MADEESDDIVFRSVFHPGLQTDMLLAVHGLHAVEHPLLDSRTRRADAEGTAGHGILARPADHHVQRGIH
jgi:hypothetical protein